MSELVILHISDLHFGIDNDRSEETKRVRLRQREMLSSLIDTLADDKCVPEDWKPAVIVVSGDIAWTGKSNEYKLYKSEFVDKICGRLGIKQDHIITCPGNHDIIRENAEDFQRPPQIRDPNIPEIKRNSFHKSPAVICQA